MASTPASPKTLPPEGGPAVTTLLRSVLFLRRVEERYAALVREGRLEGSVLHVAIGQEAVAAGVAAAKRDGDVLLSTHRGVAHCLAWGSDLKAVTAECFGRRSGLGRGLVGHMHLVDLEHAVLGTNGIVGGGLPIAAGAALALQQAGDGRCVVAFFGDGAANTGAMHEALNLAAVWRVPVLFVCENNGFQEMTRSSELTAGRVVDRAAAYDIPSVAVNGDDVLEVSAAARSLLDGVREGGGPALLECDTYRYEGHWIGDPQHYRSSTDKEAFAERDPLVKVLAQSGLSDAEYEALRTEVDREIDRAVDAAMTGERPQASDLLSPDGSRP